MQNLTDTQLCRQFTGAWKYFYNGYTAGMFTQWGSLITDLQSQLQAYNTECTQRGIKAVPCTDNFKPAMYFEWR